MWFKIDSNWKNNFLTEGAQSNDKQIWHSSDTFIK